MHLNGPYRRGSSIYGPVVDIAAHLPKLSMLAGAQQGFVDCPSPVVFPELLHDHLGSGSIMKDDPKKVELTRQHPRNAPHHQGIV